MASNLNTGPWKALKEDRRNRFRVYCRGRDAGMRGEAVRVPAHFTPEEREEVRKGWTAARRLAEEVEALEDAFARER